MFILTIDSDNEKSLGNCSHTFCASCIRKHFGECLIKKLADFREEKHIDDDLPLPTTSAQLRELSRKIKSWRGDTCQIFSYQCPQCCGVVTKAPIAAYQLRTLVIEARITLSAYLNDVNDNSFPAEGFSGATYFDSLFKWGLHVNSNIF